ncbi:(2Fe-2S)-binding protein [Aquincola tertiaricarbonis]|uniref:(2Fe-2S)-binding protein n=1 Tax=Aquincola tertiaricarbonis TaxID=391953 RepID=UPI0006153362|nr:(2Fe-2S)-binding protein [Aquincola tertiaricarbonis]
MPTDANRSPFQPLPGAAPVAMVQIRFDDRLLQVPAGTTVAAALLQSGVQRFRSSAVSGAPRAPYCMMGVCFECLVEIDGEASRQACLVTVREGMQVRTQQGLRSFGEPAAATVAMPVPAEAGHDA